MTIPLIAQWAARLAPERHKQAARRAEREALDSRQVMRDVARRHHQVEKLMDDMAADLIENHFAERVATAMGRPRP